MDKLIAQAKPLIAEFINAEILSLADYLCADDMHKEFFSWCAEFSSKGKMLRGLIILKIYSVLSRKSFEPAIPVAAAIEVLQSGILSHDDIIDDDDTRRKGPSMHSFFAYKSKRRVVADSKHYGISTAIAFSDLLFFTSKKMILSSSFDNDTLVKVISILSSKMQQCCFGEVLDITCSMLFDDASYDDIIRMYSLKTSSYSFSMPLMIGAVLSGAKDDTITFLDKCGELLGIIYQLIDDNNDFFGFDNNSLRAAGSDIREDKKTIHRSLLYSKADNDFLNSIFGNKKASYDDIKKVQELALSLGIDKEISSIISDYSSRLDELMLSNVLPELRDFIYSLFRFITSNVTS